MFLLSLVLCRLYVNWRFLHGIEAQFLALQKGFNEVIPQHLLKSFDEKELEVKDKIFYYIFQNIVITSGTLFWYSVNIYFLPPSLPSADSVWPGKDRHL